MNAIVPRNNAQHSYQVVRRTPTTKHTGEHADAKPSLQTKPTETPHPVRDFNKIFSERRLFIPNEAGPEQAITLYHRASEGSVRELQAAVMCTGRIADVLGLKEIIPESGLIDIELLGSFIYEHARQPQNQWIGADYGAARALCAYQEFIPKEPRFHRLKFVFPGTIVFDEQLGICVPMVIKGDKGWKVTHENILSNSIPGVHMHMK